MPESTKCGACNTPIKGHTRRHTGKATLVVSKIREKGRKKPQVAREDGA